MSDSKVYRQSDTANQAVKIIEILETFLARNPTDLKTEDYVDVAFEIASDTIIGDSIKAIFIRYLLTMYSPINSEFFTTSASSKFHGAHKNGLIRHSLGVTKNLMKMFVTFEDKFYEPGSKPSTDDITIEDLILASLFHDVCKIGLYCFDENNNKWVKRYNTEAFGHGIESVRRIENLVYNKNNQNNQIINPKVLEAIRWHMGNYDLSPIDQEFFHEAKKRNPLVLALHYADDLECCWNK